VRRGVGCLAGDQFGRPFAAARSVRLRRGSLAWLRKPSTEAASNLADLLAARSGVGIRTDRPAPLGRGRGEPCSRPKTKKSLSESASRAELRAARHSGKESSVRDRSSHEDPRAASGRESEPVGPECARFPKAEVARCEALLENVARASQVPVSPFLPLAGGLELLPIW
jgi:hypothetical protein